MSYSALEKELKTLPEEYLESVAEYIELLKYKISFLNQNQLSKKIPIIGLAEGKFPTPDDINAYDDEIIDIFGEYI
ncbi:DUF2281 domain-containing protein [Treponema sp. OMZ 787]|uniref:DUF2281 domain-containing protein n=1 Tax=Treponema sp. OMZ 787 TaxID=2563669 RepID=UPI0020A33E94|nr:DUF2281 domain-containing protein [Treponema sp. OMZ 787]UTC63017.1 DUF2281 domain-containing protein [Treponema sp. OMZ 787]